ncbi:uncharacterized protein V1518DRAFT_409604 [Limtongia smithiae]|uniref:uncharacterized protein n=1 Tax=Limtongia smithiae TaxID=1125753 RepID=UPI0034CF2778
MMAAQQRWFAHANAPFDSLDPYYAYVPAMSDEQQQQNLQHMLLFPDGAALSSPSTQSDYAASYVLQYAPSSLDHPPLPQQPRLLQQQPRQFGQLGQLGQIDSHNIGLIPSTMRGTQPPPPAQPTYVDSSLFAYHSLSSTPSVSVSATTASSPHPYDTYGAVSLRETDQQPQPPQQVPQLQQPSQLQQAPQTTFPLMSADLMYNSIGVVPPSSALLDAAPVSLHPDTTNGAAVPPSGGTSEMIPRHTSSAMDYTTTPIFRQTPMDYMRRVNSDLSDFKSMALKGAAAAATAASVPPQVRASISALPPSAPTANVVTPGVGGASPRHPTTARHSHSHSPPAPAAATIAASSTSSADGKRLCEICKKRFKKLDDHLWTHSAEPKPHKCRAGFTDGRVTCQYVKMGFARVADRNRHELKHYVGRFVCPFGADNCRIGSERFGRLDTFKRHLRTVHGVSAATGRAAAANTAANSPSSVTASSSPASMRSTSVTTDTPATGSEFLDPAAAAASRPQPRRRNKNRKFSASDEPLECANCSKTYFGVDAFVGHLNDCTYAMMHPGEDGISGLGIDESE